MHRLMRQLLLLGLVMGGCAKHSMSAPSVSGTESYESSKSASRERGEAAPGPGVSVYDFDDDSFSEEDGAALAGADFAAPASTTGTATVTKPEPPTVRTGEPSVDDPRKDIGGRMIIYTAGMRIAVFNLEEAMTKAETLPERFGGYVHSMGAGELVLKIPARKLRPAMAELAGYGVVEQRSLSTQDVSAEYIDIESRMRALEATHKQLLELLSKARTVDEALHVRQALDQVGSELEVLKGRMRQLDSLIAFSTLTLSLYERGPHTPTPSSNDPFPWVDSLGVEATEWK